MKVWVVTLYVHTDIDEWTPSSEWSAIEKIFDSKDKAISYVQDCIKDAIDEEETCLSRYKAKDIIDHIPTEEEIFDDNIFGVWYKTDDEVYTNEYSYIVKEYIVE